MIRKIYKYELVCDGENCESKCIIEASCEYESSSTLLNKDLPIGWKTVTQVIPKGTWPTEFEKRLVCLLCANKSVLKFKV